MLPKFKSLKQNSSASCLPCSKHQIIVRRLSGRGHGSMQKSVQASVRASLGKKSQRGASTDARWLRYQCAPDTFIRAHLSNLSSDYSVHRPWSSWIFWRRSLPCFFVCMYDIASSACLQCATLQMLSVVLLQCVTTLLRNTWSTEIIMWSLQHRCTWFIVHFRIQWSCCLSVSPDNCRRWGSVDWSVSVWS